MAALFAFLHHLAAFTLVAALAIEFVLLRDALTLSGARKLMRADTMLGLSATVVLLIGLARVFYFEKGWAYYSASIPFIAKFSLFVIAAVLSIYPTVAFLSWREPLKRGEVPIVSDRALVQLRTVIGLELAGIVLIILCAALMAKGIGYR
jgi:putative membrane protein